MTFEPSDREMVTALAGVLHEQAQGLEVDAAVAELGEAMRQLLRQRMQAMPSVGEAVAVALRALALGLSDTLDFAALRMGAANEGRLVRPAARQVFDDLAAAIQPAAPVASIDPDRPKVVPLFTRLRAVAGREVAG